MVPSESILDNPIWHALTTRHSGLSRGGTLARRYQSDIGPLSALREPSSLAFPELGSLLSPGAPAVLFLETPPEVPSGWRLIEHDPLAQMICRGVPAAPVPEYPITPLAAQDVPEMLALTALTEPGPFRERTLELGGFLGIRIDGSLAAMAGQRLALPGFIEVSAVCTHPGFRGRGLARALVAAVAANIQSHGDTPFLTVRESNAGAIRVYQTAGFVVRRTLHLAVTIPAELETRAPRP